MVCVDETSKQLIEEVRQPIPLEPGQPERFDSEYKRNGVQNIFMAFEPLAGKRRVEVTNQRTSMYFAHFVKELVDTHYSTATTIIMVVDNLNTLPKRRYTRLFHRKRPKELPIGLKFITRQNMTVG